MIWPRPEQAGTPGGTRTPGPLLRRQLLYPPELQARLERVMGIEPTRPAWKAGILPLNYTRMVLPLTSAFEYYHIFHGLSMVFIKIQPLKLTPNHRRRSSPRRRSFSLGGAGRAGSG